MKLFFFIILLFLNFNKLIAQPISTPSITIKNISAKKNDLFGGTSNGIEYQLYKINKNKEYSNNYISIRVNKYYSFIYGKDTMKIKLIFGEYSYYRITINKLFFKKGNYIIDLKKCVKEKGLIIEKFPCDCVVYRKEEEE